MKFEIGCCSRTGLVRNTNEDAMLIRSADCGALFLVADGIGGREHGEIVSGMLRDGYAQWWEQHFLPASARLTFPGAIEEIKNVLFRMNREVVECYGEAAAGSTLALLFLFRGNCLYLSAGDSRIYLARSFSFRQVTVDDVVGNGNEKDQLSANSMQGKLLGALGISAVPAFSIRTDVLKNHDRFFLCSDGVYRYLSPKILSRYMLHRQQNPDRLITDFSLEIERNGARDNYTMIYIQVKDVRD